MVSAGRRTPAPEPESITQGNNAGVRRRAWPRGSRGVGVVCGTPPIRVLTRRSRVRRLPPMNRYDVIAVGGSRTLALAPAVRRRRGGARIAVECWAAAVCAAAAPVAAPQRAGRVRVGASRYSRARPCRSSRRRSCATRCGRRAGLPAAPASRTCWTPFSPASALATERVSRETCAAPRRCSAMEAQHLVYSVPGR